MKATAPFRNGERIVCLGDSTTQDGYWLYYLTEYVLCRTGRRVEFINAGVFGGNAGGALTRLEYDVIDRHPSRVILNLGMNDVRRELYYTETPEPELAMKRREALAGFRANMTMIIERLLEKEIEVILMTTLPFDQYHPEISAAKELICCNSEGLARLNGMVRELAERFGLSLVDIFTPMTEIYRVHPEMRIAADRVHPERFGYLLAAAKMIEIIYGKRENSLFLSPDTCRCRNVAIDGVRFSPDGCQFIWHPRHLPFHRGTDYHRAARLLDLDSLLNTETLRIAGLPNARYRLRVGGSDCGFFSATELETGINVTMLPTPLAAIAENMATLTEMLNHADLPLRRLAQCELIVREHQGDPGSDADTKRILELYLTEIAGEPYCDYYHWIFQEYWQLRPDRKRFAELREETLHALYRSIRIPPCPVKLFAVMPHCLQ